MTLRSISPWDGTVVGECPVSDRAAVDAAIDRLDQQRVGWAMAHAHRHTRLRQLAEVCTAQRAAIIDLLVREAGKTTADATTEADLLPRKIAITLDQAWAQTPPPPEAVTSGQALTVWRPRGLALVLGPYNFPLHLLHGLVVPALAVGCPVLAKPSERCPAIAQLYARLIAAAGLDDVCAVLPGDATTAAAAVADPRIATVAAVGGWAMGAALQRQLAGRPEVVLALELGGINHALVCADADPDTTAVHLADGAWRLAGQRCTATRVVHVPRGQCVAWHERLHALQRTWMPTAGPDGLQSRMISRDVREQFQTPWRNLPSSLRILAGSPLAVTWPCAAEPLLLSADDASHPFLACERFGPALTVCAYDDEATALLAMQRNNFRLACSVFTGDDVRFAALAAQLPYGLVNRNRPTAGARSDLPFGGLGHSGNHRPAALAANRIFAEESVIWG